MSARAVITGLGVAAPTGLGAVDHWSAIRGGRSAIAPLTRFDPSSYRARLAGQVPEFEPREHLPGRLLPQTDHMTRMALIAADWALADAGVDPAEVGEFDMGVVTASSSGGFAFGQQELQSLWGKGGEYVSAYQSFAWFYAVNTGQISIRNGMRGPSGVLVSDQAGGLDALGQARRHVRRGTALIVAGGVDSSLCPWGWVALQTSGRLSGVYEPARAYLPFDRDARGHVPGEGGALMVVESAEAAHDRGATPYGEISGYAATFDPAPGTGREPGLRRAIEQALADAELEPWQIAVVFADAAALPDLDRAEADALAAVFGAGAVPVTVPKAATGRLYSGAGALDVATALLSLRDGVLPPTVHSVADPTYEIDLVTETRPVPGAAHALVLGRGQGGFNSALVLTGAAAGQVRQPAG